MTASTPSLSGSSAPSRTRARRERAPAVGLELPGGVLRRPAVAGAAGVTAFQRVIGQVSDVRPPAATVWSLLGAGAPARRCQQDTPDSQAHPSSHRSALHSGPIGELPIR